MSEAGVKGYLLMITDLEGCAPIDFASRLDPKLKQTTVLCKSSTFNNIARFLEKNEKNAVAFLGDYFDKGPHVVESIIGIIYLHTKYTGQVHIILGNRDINKLRLKYEIMLPDQNPVLKDRTPKTGFNEIYKRPEGSNDILNGPSSEPSSEPSEPSLNPEKQLVRFQQITSKSMAGMTETENNKIHPILNEQVSFDWLYGVFVDDAILFEYDGSAILSGMETLEIPSELSDLRKLFTYCCRQLYTVGQLVTLLPHFRALLSHGGGFDGSTLSVASRLNLSGIDIVDKHNYLLVLEQCRLQLTREIATAETANTLRLKDVIDAHNSLYIKALSSFFLPESPVGSTPTTEYMMLQAMGLKPDGLGSNYASFVHACGHEGGCKLLFNDDKTLVDYLYDGGVRFIGSGHVPHCTTVPMIYKQNGTDGTKSIVFIANDTSNGYRPENPENPENPLLLQNIPLSYIEENPASSSEVASSEVASSEVVVCGICSIKSDGDLLKANEDTEPPTILALSKDGTNNDYYRASVKSYTNIDEIPDTTKIKVLFNAPGSYAALVPVVPAVLPTGGRRRSIKVHKRSKKTKKQRQIKTRRRNRKYTCNHCGR